MNKENKRPRFQHIFSNFNKSLPDVNEIINKNVSDNSNNTTQKNKYCLNENEVKNLSKLLSIYRSKKYETFRYILLDNENNIVDHLGLSFNMKDASPAFLKNKEATTKNICEADFFTSIINYVKKNNLRIIVAHNHPSGIITPSEKDIILTSKIEFKINELGGKNKFFGHIILDHGKVNYYTPSTNWKDKGKHKNLDFKVAEWNDNFEEKEEGWNKVTFNTSKTDNLLKKKTKSYQGLQINAPDKIKKIEDITANLDAKENWNLSKYTPVFCLNHQMFVVGVKFFDNEDILRKSKTNRGIASIKNELEKTSKNYSIEGFIPFISNQDLIPVFTKIAEKDVFVDMCIKTKNDAVSWLSGSNEEAYFFNIDRDASHLIPSLEASLNFKNSKAGKQIEKKCFYNER